MSVIFFNDICRKRYVKFILKALCRDFYRSLSISDKVRYSFARHSQKERREGRDRERKREKERKRERDVEKERKKERERQREREREREREIKRESD